MKPYGLAVNQCPAANSCIFTSEQGPPCGESSEHLSPLLLAEAICPRALAGVIKKEEAELEHPLHTAGRHTTLAWHHLESGIVAPDELEATRHFDAALERANSAMHTSYTVFQDILPAAILQLYRPIFMARRYGVPPSPDESTRLRKELGVIFDALYAAPIHEPSLQHIRIAMDEGRPHQPCVQGEGYRKSMAVKLVAMMLASRRNVFINPASDREAQASRESMGLNHDGYLLRDGQKVLIKIGSKGKTDAVMNRGGVAYDDRVLFINFPGLINELLKKMQQYRPEQYRSLLAQNGRQRPDVTTVGRLLQSEQFGRRLSVAALGFLDDLTADLFQRLGIDQASKDQMWIKSEDLPWSVLPADILKRQRIPSTQEDQSHLREAVRAREQYLRAGNAPPARKELQSLITQMRRVSTPHILVCCAGAYMDLARSSETSPAEASALVDAATAITDTFAAKRWQDIAPDKLDLLFRCRLERAYAEMYKKALSGSSPDLDDLSRLYMDLLHIGSDTLAPAADPQYDVRGVQFELGIHLLNIRASLRRGQIIQWTWPSLPRENDPHDFEFTFRNGWDMALTTRGFLDQDESCFRIQLKSADEGVKYSPGITIIRGREDLLTDTSASLILAAIQELQGSSAEAITEAKKELNRCEQIVMQKTIGLTK